MRNLYFASSCDLSNRLRIVEVTQPSATAMIDFKRKVSTGVWCGGIMEGFCLEDHHITSRQSGAKLGISLGL